jgi:hypothetical protein
VTGDDGFLGHAGQYDQAAIRAFLPALDPMTTGGLVTFEKVQTPRYGPDVRRAPT